VWRIIRVKNSTGKKNIIVYWRSGCPFCTLAVDLLEKHNIEYELKKLGEDFTREDFSILLPGAKTFPQVIVDGVSIGGYEQLEKKVLDLI
tara:strand:- start:104 stop:373 length:270 start_codon:yes stop_codon:yes gene_type:complete